MKRFAALVLAVALFAAPTVGFAAEWNGPALEDIFDEYVETIVFGE